MFLNVYLRSFTGLNTNWLKVTQSCKKTLSIMTNYTDIYKQSGSSGSIEFPTVLHFHSQSVLNSPVNPDIINRVKQLKRIIKTNAFCYFLAENFPKDSEESNKNFGHIYTTFLNKLFFLNFFTNQNLKLEPL